jgi:hypothetical protein
MPPIDRPPTTKWGGLAHWRLHCPRSCARIDRVLRPHPMIADTAAHEPRLFTAGDSGSRVTTDIHRRIHAEQQSSKVTESPKAALPWRKGIPWGWVLVELICAKVPISHSRSRR